MPYLSAVLGTIAIHVRVVQQVDLSHVAAGAHTAGRVTAAVVCHTFYSLADDTAGVVGPNGCAPFLGGAVSRDGCAMFDEVSHCNNVTLLSVSVQPSSN